MIYLSLRLADGLRLRLPTSDGYGGYYNLAKMFKELYTIPQAAAVLQRCGLVIDSHGKPIPSVNRAESLEA
jgi:hypothetical protein